MNVLFTDKFTHKAWKDTAQTKQHRFLRDWLLDKMLNEGWADRDDDFPNETEPKDLWDKISGEIALIYIYADPSQTQWVGEKLMCREFSWGIFTIPVDQYGELKFMPIRPPHEHRRLIGGLFNHGTHADPIWSSNT